MPEGLCAQKRFHFGDPRPPNWSRFGVEWVYFGASWCPIRFFLALVRTCSGIHVFQSSVDASEAPNWGFGAERACLFAQVSIWTTTLWLLTGLPPFYSCRRPCLPSQQHRSHGRSGPAKGGLHIGRHRAQCLLLTVEGPLKFSGARAGMYRRRPAPAPLIIINKELVAPRAILAKYMYM